MNRSPRAAPATSTTTTSHQPPQPITRSEPNSPYPTTFVQADTSSFKQVVQMLTGSSETAKHASNPIPSTRPASKPKPSRLYERRNTLKNFRISPLLPGFGSNTRNPDMILSPSLLDFPALALSPVTPLLPDPFNPDPNTSFLDKAAEEKAIKEKGFYLHRSPRESEPPKLLPLFPVTSPKQLSGPDCSSS